jgi:hypothetical protein
MVSTGPGMILSVLRIGAAWLALFATALLVAGCGGSVRAASRPITREQAVVFAHAVNLRAGDVPGMDSFGDLETNGGVVNFRLTPTPGCGSGDNGEEFDVYSPVFRRGRGARFGGGAVPLPAEGLHSKVAVRQSAAEQERDFSAHVCDEAVSHAASRSTRTQTLRSLLPGVRVLGERTWRVAPRASFRAATVTLYSDRFSFVVGPAVVVLAVSGAPRPPHAQLERRLLALLYSRAEAHKLS